MDIFDTSDILWAMTTRYQGARSTVFIPGVIGHPLDPSQDPEYSPDIPARGISTKTIFDCTVLFALKPLLARSRFMELDPDPFLKPSPHPFIDQNVSRERYGSAIL